MGRGRNYQKINSLTARVMLNPYYTHDSQPRNNTIKYGIILLVAFTSIKLWSFSAISEGLMNIIEIFVLSILFVIAVYNFNKIQTRRSLFKTNVHFFIWLPFLSAFGALVFHHQSLPVSLLVLRANFYWLLYFLLHLFEIPPKKIINLMIVIGCGWILLTSLQQFTYPRYYFYTKDEENHSILRAGVYRFMVLGQQYGLFVLFYFFYRYMITAKLYNLIYVMMGLCGFYFYGTRQFALAAVVCMCVGILFIRSNARFRIIFLTISMFIVTWLISGVFLKFSIKDALFNQYVEMTNEQLQYGDDIRLRSANFYLYEYWPHWLAKFIGNGQAYGKSVYGAEMDMIRAKYHYYRSDVGIIGAYNQFGLFYVLNILWVNFKGLFNKFYSYENRYLKLFYVNSIFLLALSEYYSNGSGIPFYCFIFYLTDKSFEEQLSQQNDA